MLRVLLGALQWQWLLSTWYFSRSINRHSVITIFWYSVSCVWRFRCSWSLMPWFLIRTRQTLQLDYSGLISPIIICHRVGRILATTLVWLQALTCLILFTDRPRSLVN